MSTTHAADPTDDAHLLRCWALQECGRCLEEPDCSWCPFSWTCIPNSHPLQLLAPAYDENICPHWRERWEIRTKPLGCHVSTITTLTSFATIACTLVLVLLVAIIACGVKKLKQHIKKHPGWWRFWRRDWRGWLASWTTFRIRLIDSRGTPQGQARPRQEGSEQEPLLPS